MRLAHNGPSESLATTVFGCARIHAIQRRAFEPLRGSTAQWAFQGFARRRDEIRVMLSSSRRLAARARSWEEAERGRRWLFRKGGEY